MQTVPMLNPVSPPLDARSRALRKLCVEAIDGAGRGHLPSALSLIEVLRVLYDDVMRYRAAEPMWLERDRCILSKGHGCLGLYAILADKGYFSRDLLRTYCSDDTILGGHPERGKVPGAEASTGALGHGLAIGIGMAIAARIQKRDSRTFVITGDGEINEGSIWEGAKAASKHRLDNLTVIVDRNTLQSYGRTVDVQDLEPLTDKWRAFGFAVADVDGHDVEALRGALKQPLQAGKPTCVIAHTIKGKGIPHIENNAEWHHRSKVTADDLSKLYAAQNPATEAA